MNLYHVSQETNNDYDTYSDFVVASNSTEEAQRTHPQGLKFDEEKRKWYYTYGMSPTRYYRDTTWASIDDVTVRLIGLADPNIECGVICASFHAG